MRVSDPVSSTLQILRSAPKTAEFAKTSVRASANLRSPRKGGEEGGAKAPPRSFPLCKRDGRIVIRVAFALHELEGGGGLAVPASEQKHASKRRAGSLEAPPVLGLGFSSASRLARTADGVASPFFGLRSCI